MKNPYPFLRIEDLIKNQIDVTNALINTKASSLNYANKLSNHIREVEILLNQNFSDILPVSQIHFTRSYYFQINRYSVMIANHPDDRTHVGSVIPVKSTIREKTFGIVFASFLY